MEQGHSTTNANAYLHTMQQQSTVSIQKVDGKTEPLDFQRLRRSIMWAVAQFDAIVDIEYLIQETIKNIYDGVSKSDIADALILSATAHIELDPAYGFVAARLLFKKLFKEVTRASVASPDFKDLYTRAFKESMHAGVQAEILSPAMLDFDMDYLAMHIDSSRDELFDFMGLRTLYERYFIKVDHKRVELPQIFWMRVAMGLCQNETEKNERAVEFYHIISQMKYVPSTPTLLHSGLTRAQLSSCFLNTVSDDLTHIFKCIGDNAQLSKWSGGIGTDWTNIRGCGAWIKSIRTESQGVVPFLKISNDTTAAINRSGKRRSAACVYLETWHIEIEDFLDLRRNTGDERRRTHDINTANWVPDLFMQRVQENTEWTLFSPEEVPELHHLYGAAFKEKYEYYESQARAGNITLFKTIPAQQLWRKMLTRLFETGHPWLTFKDACNVRSPQDHAGVIHASNLCTEITLNTSEDETAVCNIGSVNLSRHCADESIDWQDLKRTVKTAIRMLDNVIDLCFYPTKEARNSNFRHRPIGLGLMGLQDVFYKLEVDFHRPEAIDLSDQIMEFISYHAILSSSQLAKERGTYESYKGSKWDRNIFPQDTIALLEKERGSAILVKKEGVLDWTPVREHVKQYGMRNSNTMAIAPTATIANISGCFPCIEPIYKNLYVKANMSGEFTIVNKYLINDLKKLGLWNQDMLEKLKYYDGSVQYITELPQWVKDKYKEAFEIDPFHCVNMTAARGKWIDQSQSHNVFVKGASGKLLSELYLHGWNSGLKTFYYLRSLGATQIEKSTLDAQKYGFTQKREYQDVSNDTMFNANQVCSLSADPSCEVCQ